VALSERLDPEDLRDLLTSYRRLCQDAIGRYEGHISQFLGDGVMAYFGYPAAHEDDAVRATSAALSIVEGIKLVNHGIGKRLHAELHVRVGLSTGVAVIGDVGPGGADDHLAHGEAVNMASRVQASADVDTVVATSSTAKLIEGHFELKALGAQILKGFSKPADLFRVDKSTGARTKFEAGARGGLTPHIGRKNELSALEAVWKEVLDGRDRAVLVRGEAGIGKSRFLHTFRHSVIDEGTRVLECFCSPLTQGTELASVVAMLDGRIDERAEGEKQASKLAALAGMLAEHSRFSPEALPLLAGLLSIPGADQTPIETLSLTRRRSRTLEILRDWMAWSAERAPLALLVEDVHWADPSTLEFIELVLNESPGGRTLLCMTARPEFSGPWPPDKATLIELDRLDPSETESMVIQVAAGRPLAPLVAARIAERSEGVPLFVEEVTKAALEPVITPPERSTGPSAVEDGLMPSTVHGSLLARFDRLKGAAKVALHGAAIGRQFTYALIRAVSDLDEDSLRGHLEAIHQSGLAFVEGEPPNAVYTFKHALIQDAIYGTLVRDRRIEVHELIFKALSSHFPEVSSSRPEVLAHHAENAGRRAAAQSLFAEAGKRSLSRMAVAEAVKHLAHAIDLVDALQEPERTTMEIELQAAIGPAYTATLGWGAQEVERSFARLKSLAASTGDTPRVFQAMWGLWSVKLLRAQLDAGLTIARELNDLAQPTGDPLLRMLGHHALGYTHMFRAEYADAIAHADSGLALFDLERERWIASVFQLSSSSAMWCFRAEAQQALGRIDDSDESVRQWRKLLETLGHPPSTAYSLVQQCCMFYMRGNAHEVHRLATDARVLSLSEGFRLWIPITEIFLAWVRALKGQEPGAALADLRAGKRKVRDALTYIREIELTGALAETMLLANRGAEVAPAIADALRITVSGALRHNESQLFRLEGDAAKTLGDFERARELYRAGIDRARAVGAMLAAADLASALSALDSGDNKDPVTASCA
jgi:class 3 adenylate cyclase